MSILQTNLLLRPTSSIPSHSTLYPSPSIQVFPARPNRSPTLISCKSQIENDGKSVERKKIRLGLPLGGMEPRTLKLLEDCQLPFKRGHPKNYGPHILETSDTEVWFQFEKDIIGGSGVLISPLTYISDEETPRWSQLLAKLGL